MKRRIERKEEVIEVKHINKSEANRNEMIRRAKNRHSDQMHMCIKSNYNGMKRRKKREEDLRSQTTLKAVNSNEMIRWAKT